MSKNALERYSACHVVPCYRVLLTILCFITLQICNTTRGITSSLQRMDIFNLRGSNLVLVKDCTYTA
jgi:hypothetical protein